MSVNHITSRNGVESRVYAAWGGSYVVNACPGQNAVALEYPTSILVEPLPNGVLTNDIASKHPVGVPFTIQITGSVSGSVWGDGVYTTDSSLATAAVHCGAIKDGESGSVTVTILPGQESYNSSIRNGVTSQAWGSWGKSFVVQKTAVPGTGGKEVIDELRGATRYFEGDGRIVLPAPADPIAPQSGK